MCTTTVNSEQIFQLHLMFNLVKRHLNVITNKRTNKTKRKKKTRQTGNVFLAFIFKTLLRTVRATLILTMPIPNPKSLVHSP